METVNGCLVLPPSEAPEPARFGPTETQGAYVVMVGSFPPGEPGPPLHLHPHTDEAFYVGDGDATFLLGDREVPVTAGGLGCVPQGTADTVWTAGDRPLRGLARSAPRGGEYELDPMETG